MLLAAEAHLGTKNCDFQMERYVYKRRSDGIQTLNLDSSVLVLFNNVRFLSLLIIFRFRLIRLKLFDGMNFFYGISFDMN